jgi:hypothetical protein
MYEGYVEKWGLDDRWEVLVVEYKTVVPLRYAPTKTGRPGRMSKFDLKMIIDLVIRDRDTGRIWIIDHKSHANLPKARELELDDQFGLYTWGLRQLGHKIFGCIYNTARTTRNKGDFQENLDEWHRKKAAGEKPGALPKQQTLDERYDRYLMNRTVPETDAAAQDALSTALNLYSKANRGERHTNSDTCRWKCDYTEACLLGRKTGDDREHRVQAGLYPSLIHLGPSVTSSGRLGPRCITHHMQPPCPRSKPHGTILYDVVSNLGR